MTSPLRAAEGKPFASCSSDRPKLLITDLRMPDLDGLELLRRIADDQIQTTVIIITAFGTIETAVQAMRLGAYDYVTKPIDYEALLLAVHRAMERQSLIDEVRNLRSALDRRYGFESIIGHSKSLLTVLEKASRVAQHDTTVLINGETGTGKELLARAIHHNSRRRNQPFVTINCGAIPKELIEAELFGFARGAFTGANANKPGKVEMADGGTLFLDEIGELPLEAQVKLLRLIQHGEIERVGATTIKVINVRIIAATHRNLSAMVEDGDLPRRSLLPPGSRSALPATAAGAEGGYLRDRRIPVSPRQGASRNAESARSAISCFDIHCVSMAGKHSRTGKCD